MAESEKRNIAGVLGEEIQTLHLQNRNLQEEVTTYATSLLFSASCTKHLVHSLCINRTISRHQM